MNQMNQPIQTHPPYTIKFRLGWLLQMAWRDSRRSRSRLLLFISSVIVGIAALVAIYSLGNNLNDAINNQAAALLGADVKITSNQPLTPTMQHLVDSLHQHSNYSEEKNFASMVLFKKNGGTRLVQVRALQGNFPYYGALETEPIVAGMAFRTQQQALVDATLMLQFGAQVGDSIQIGNVPFQIAGKLLNAPGQTGFSAAIAPIVYIPLQYVQQTGLLQKGSRVGYQFYFHLNTTNGIDKWATSLRPILEANDCTIETIETQKESTGRTFADLTSFLSLVGFIALLLGCTGVAGAVHVYVKEKVDAIAVLRCLGVKASQAFAVFLIQIMGIGLVGAMFGAVLGIGIQQLLPFVFSDFLPVHISTSISWVAVGQGICIGLIIAILFALLPLLSIRNISPLRAIRAAYETTPRAIYFSAWWVYVLIALFVYGFAYLQIQEGKQALQFTIGIAIALLVLTAIARLLMWMIKRFFPSSRGYIVRQALANLYRPNNQTSLLMVSIGLGTSFISILFFMQDVLMQRLNLSAAANQPNIVLFDIQSSQKHGVDSIAHAYHLPVGNLVPIVNMRLAAWNNIQATAALTDTARKLPRGLFRREYRVTYRDSLTASEKIVAGIWRGEYNGKGLPYISMETNYAKRNQVRIGDTLTFNVQGANMYAIVGSLRQVNWGGMQTNFLVVFPKGVLEAAPQFWVLLTKVPNQQVSARFQQSVVQQFPNVSIIDLALVLQILNDIISKIGFVIRFMAGLSICTGIVVFIASVYMSKYQRIRETVLLRTLGASRKQIFAITVLEYLFLGLLAAITGILLGLTAGWALAKYTFETSFHPQLIPIILLIGFVCVLTVSIGLINSRGIVKRSPLEVLRSEG